MNISCRARQVAAKHTLLYRSLFRIPRLVAAGSTHYNLLGSTHRGRRHQRRQITTGSRVSATETPQEEAARENDTIFALSTHPGKAALAIVRISGPQTGRALQLMLPGGKRSAESPLPARLAAKTRIVDPKSGDTLDTGLCIWFPGPRSFTGENMAELHVHGGSAVIASVLHTLGSIPGLRMAEAGEFSRRAFDNDKMDLTTLEGVADLINAETEAQRRLAVRQAGGELCEMYERWREQMVALMANIEAYIDFSEEENIDDGVLDNVRRLAASLKKDIASHLNDGRRGEILRSGVSLAIVGPPNSGKSTLLNRLAQRQVAIVSPVAGTTRDIIETTLDIGGYPLVVRDTAGLRHADGDAIEAEGIRRALASAREADMRICLLDATQVLNQPTTLGDILGADEWQALLSLPHTFVVLNKADQLPQGDAGSSERASAWARAQTGGDAALISCQSMFGWDELMQKVAGHIRSSWEGGESLRMPLTKARHRQHLSQCLQRLELFEQAGDQWVLAAEELRAASSALGRITGRVGIEDVLDALFSQFCIGK
ncbi:tRNA modification GTPase gtpbp3, mitochondrial [Coemansia furcata]|uniref:tRNA modification GTPase gtpbp3, mitochondrial n=1 Tax=Coemansia furcata TaxID=417177 RepID=A0ACC1L3U5_9FUNG|nr:tRNA modification GTPase gtpbp3, mitochondrial [Coemansia furcata]